MSGTSFADRLLEAVGDESIHAFSKKSGISDSSLRGYLKGAMPGADIALKIAEVAKVDLKWLIAGTGSKEIKPPEDAFEGGALDSRGRIVNEIAFIPRLDVQASAGMGSLVVSEDTVDILAFNRNWLRERSINAVAARVLDVKGDSMEPTIRDGDILVVDTSITQVRDNAIYVIIYAGNVLVKRVHLKRDGSLTLISDNERYPREDVPIEEVPDLHIAGRVMWFGRSI
ncbi:helix-turn-helix transcriptional regulator [Rhizobium ruizarguesonis]|jgi:phage repressor protein C with HTH and peptisase S24 domain|uniref:S24 family peptidase n=1 Tax=Rhizobium TaxID=379 RepID=UPI00036363AE|nr:MULTISPECIES: helix-turn-helix transcriptional regulator [Rhizobium]QHW25854.1 helix-turn-helix transcriptional regulator [Rhizobium leguminosarum bv. viciae 248]TAV99991.1 helix-turn-helix transcriptional regulator [Rhizobium ruizarguesonis]TBY69728.1 helix-turn-helix transcriptional regulator [Rhizobium leguminosarum bv. viciae]